MQFKGALAWVEHPLTGELWANRGSDEGSGDSSHPPVHHHSDLQIIQLKCKKEFRPEGSHDCFCERMLKYIIFKHFQYMYINATFQIAGSFSAFLSQQKLNIMPTLSNEEGFFLPRLYFNHYIRPCMKNSIICLKKSPKKNPTLESKYIYLFILVKGKACM